MSGAVAQEIVAQIKKWREEFQHLYNTVNVVIDDCQRFELPMPTFAALDQVFIIIFFLNIFTFVKIIFYFFLCEFCFCSENYLFNLIKNKKVDKDILSHECAWQLYEEFTTEREKLIDEEWVSFRAHLSDFQDFIDFWSGQQRNLTKVFFFVLV